MTEEGLRILSGGQTGVDRAALDAARSLEIPSGGWVPAGRRAEDGPIPPRYRGLRETPTRDPAERTRRNVEGADAVLFLLRGEPRGGTRLALETARELGRPYLELQLEATPDAVLAAWLQGLPLPLRLNVAGPRESEAPGIHAQARRVLEAGLLRFRRGR